MRKGAFFPRLALVNLLRNQRFYGPYLLSAGGAAAMFYIIRYLTASEIVASVRGAAYLTSLMQLGTMVVIPFSAVLLLYANSFVMKRRQRELGLYNILGLEKRHIALVCFWETVYCALVTVIGGLAVGVLLSKLLLLLLLQLAHLPVSFGFEISPGAMASTAMLFLLLFALTLVSNLIRVARARPVELLRSAQVGEREPRSRKLLALVGAVTLAAGYGMALTVQKPMEALSLFFLAVVLVMVGTYCLFMAGSIVLLKRLRTNPRYYYQTRHFTAVSGLLYRMKQNAVGLANICILSTMVLVTVSTTASLYLGLEQTLDQMYPFDLEAIQYQSPIDDPEDPRLEPEVLLERVQENLAATGLEATHLGWYTEEQGYGTFSGNTIQWEQAGTAIDLRILTAEDYGSYAGRELTLAEDEAAVYTQGFDLPNSFYFGEQLLRVAERLEEPIRSNDATAVRLDGEPELVLVVADEDVRQALLSQPYAEGAEQTCGDLFSRKLHIQMNLTGSDAEKAAAADAVMANTGGQASHVSRQDNEVELYAMYGGFVFLGIFLGLLFLLVTALIIYYKQISEGYEDQRRYQIMRQVGMTDREVRASVRSQILLVFFLPLGTAGLHTLAAFPMLTKMLRLFQLTNDALFALCTAGTLLIFCVIYGLVYSLTARTYRKIVA
jgi:putative ABC transport system permease protein